MTHQLVLHIHRADPLAAGFDQVLRAIDDADVTVLVEARDIAGAQPAICSELVRLVRNVVIAAGDEVAANLDLADAVAVPRLHLVAVADDPQVDERRRYAGSRRETDALLFGVVLQLRLHERAACERA